MNQNKTTLEKVIERKLMKLEEEGIENNEHEYHELLKGIRAYSGPNFDNYINRYLKLEQDTGFSIWDMRDDNERGGE